MKLLTLQIVQLFRAEISAEQSKRESGALPAGKLISQGEEKEKKMKEGDENKAGKSCRPERRRALKVFWKGLVSPRSRLVNIKHYQCRRPLPLLPPRPPLRPSSSFPNWHLKCALLCPSWMGFSRRVVFSICQARIDARPCIPRGKRCRPCASVAVATIFRERMSRVRAGECLSRRNWGTIFLNLFFKWNFK